MDQKVRNSAGLFSAIIILICGLMILPIAIGALLSTQDTTAFMLGLMLFVASSLLIYGGIKMLIKSRNEKKRTEEIFNKVIEETNKTITLNSKTSEVLKDHSEQKNAAEVLAQWNFNKKEWTDFIKWETKERRVNTIIEASWVLILGTLMIVVFRNGNFLIAALISLIIGLIYYFFKIKLTSKSYKTILNENKIIITPVAVIINDSFNAFRNEDYWLGTVKILKEANFSVFEIEYHWNTRRGGTFDEIRIPIPHNKLEEAEKVKNQLLNIS